MTSFLDSLIYEATIPVILDLTKKATFETWANRMEEANDLYHEALALQQKYNQVDNQEINIALVALNEKMDNRVCVNLDNKIFELQKIVENRLKLFRGNVMNWSLFLPLYRAINLEL